TVSPDDPGRARSSSDPRPRPAIRHGVALALSGSGRRGGSHMGVLKVLEELHVPIDCIAGTSMGARVGGGYASGMTASEIGQFIRKVDWKPVVGGCRDSRARARRAEAVQRRQRIGRARAEG